MSAFLRLPSHTHRLAIGSINRNEADSCGIPPLLQLFAALPTPSSWGIAVSSHGAMRKLLGQEQGPSPLAHPL